MAAALSDDEMACVYCAAILYDDDVPVTEDKIKTLLKAAGVEVEGIWPTLFSRALQGQNVRQMLTQAMMGGAGAGPQAGPTDAAPPKDAPAATEDKKAESEDSDSDDDMGFGLFD